MENSAEKLKAEICFVVLIGVLDGPIVARQEILLVMPKIFFMHPLITFTHKHVFQKVV